MEGETRFLISGMRISANKIEKIRQYAANGRVVVFDTETTGCLRHDEICQIAAVEYIGGVRARTFSVYVCPTCEMNPWAEAVHGLSLDFLSEHGLAPEEAMRQFFEFLGNDVMLVAHNNRFDMRMLRQETYQLWPIFTSLGTDDDFLFVFPKDFNAFRVDVNHKAVK